MNTFVEMNGIYINSNNIDFIAKCKEDYNKTIIYFNGSRSLKINKSYEEVKTDIFYENDYLIERIKSY